jgi:signal transduction histidine kinase
MLDVGLDMLAWTLAVAIVGVVSIQTPAGPQLGMDMPVLLAAGFVLGPIPAGWVAVAGYVDLRELRGEIALDRALFNRAQTSLSVMAATGLFALVGAPPNHWPVAFLAALVAVGVDCVVNYAMVAGVVTLHERLSPRASFDRLRLGSLIAFAGTYFCFGLLSLQLAEVYILIGIWGLVLFATPLFLARRALATSQQLERAELRVGVQLRALRQSSARVADERRDERLTIAAELHDDVLPPLFKVHLLGQVLRQELATGQLLAMEEDLPALVAATNEASQTLRERIRSLRSSPLGTYGLSRTLRLLVRQLTVESNITFQEQIDDVKATPVVELLAYQVAREALRNAIQYSHAALIRVILLREEDRFRLIVEDDGCGFVPTQVDESRHFGIALMRERVEMAGGVLQIESAPGEGARLAARLPLTNPVNRTTP